MRTVGSLVDTYLHYEDNERMNEYERTSDENKIKPTLIGTISILGAAVKKIQFDILHFA